MSDVVLVGPFWTRSETASYLGQTPDELLDRTDVLRLSGRWLEETYPAFQFRDHEIRLEISTVVTEVGEQLTGTAIADWLLRSNPLLGAMSPNDWFNAGLNMKPAITALYADLEDARRRVPHHTAAARAS